jgi:phosphoribosylglycinamide formyltransferase-1
MTASTDKLPVVVLISGSGSNLQALIEASTRNEAAFFIRAVISNRPTAKGLQRAAAAGIETRVIDHTDYPDRDSFDAELGDSIEAFGPGLVVLAGFMRILTDGFVARFYGRMLNIHPSLLPDFQGLHTHRRAIEAGVTEHGASVHFVTAELDGGPVIAQVRVPVEAADDESTLAERVLRREHELLPQVVDWFARNRLRLRDSRIWLDGRVLARPAQC